MRGAVAAGHPKTTEAACLTLEAGGNAFDAALAALATACVVEPVLTSLGGGGFLTARLPSGRTQVFDFFVQTPKRRRPAEDLDFRPIVADFGGAQQEFHIGPGSIATPGTVRGLFDVHDRLARLPMAVILEPAIGYARQGIRLNRLQAYIFNVIEPIYVATEGARQVFGSEADSRRLPREGEVLRMPDLADALEALGREGARLFYEGEIGRSLVSLCTEHGGQLQASDLRAYRTRVRAPLERRYRDTRLLTNPPPSSGGLLIAFAQELLSSIELARDDFGSARHLTHLARAMELTNQARGEKTLDVSLLEADLIERYRQAIGRRPVTARGTTHVSVIDQEGNAAALTLSNGEGCGHVLPGTGIMPNNMLGEEDLNPLGFHSWSEDVRVSSMMAPSIVQGRPAGGRTNETLIAIGSGGSNRLRTAILQTLSNLIDFGMPVEAAVAAPRIHFERGLISIEPGFGEHALQALIEHYPEHQSWDELNLFFGGTHTVVFDGRRFSGAGDPRRGGHYRELQ